VPDRLRPAAVKCEGGVFSKLSSKPSAAGPNVDITRGFRARSCIIRNYKEHLPFVVEVPVKIPFILDSGDPPLPEIDTTQPILDVRDSKELQTADETTKKLVSIEFASRKYKVKAIEREYIKKVQRHKYDFDSLEVKIAVITARIRNHLELVKMDWRIAKRRVLLQHMLQFRTKYLKILRKEDYRRFAWIVDTLDLEYRAPPCFPFKVTYKQRFQMLATDLCRRIRAERVLAYRDKLRSQQAAFMKQKEDTLRWIAEQEQKYDLKPEETEVKQEPTNWYQFLPPRYKHPEMPPPKVSPPPVE
jgi:small subunit ribosomal protein S15